MDQPVPGLCQPTGADPKGHHGPVLKSGISYKPVVLVEYDAHMVKSE